MSGRIRSIKPDWMESEKLASCSDGARLLSVGLILLADDHGNGRASPTYLRTRVWAYREDVTSGDVDARLAELVRVGFVKLYEIDGERFFTLPGWKKHQRVDKPGKPHVGAPDEGRPVDLETLAGVSRGSREGLARPSGTGVGAYPQVPESTQFARVSRGTPESLARTPETLAPDLDQDQEDDQEQEGESEGGKPPPSAPPVPTPTSTTTEPEPDRHANDDCDPWGLGGSDVPFANPGPQPASERPDPAQGPGQGDAGVRQAPPPPESRTESPKRRRRTKATDGETPCPSSKATDAEVEAWLLEHDIPPTNAAVWGPEVEKFLDRCRSKGIRAVDWGATWRTHASNAVKWEHVTTTSEYPKMRSKLPARARRRRVEEGAIDYESMPKPPPSERFLAMKAKLEAEGWVPPPMPSTPAEQVVLLAKMAGFESPRALDDVRDPEDV